MRTHSGTLTDAHRALFGLENGAEAPQHAQVSVSAFLTCFLLPETRSFCPSPIFILYMFGIASRLCENSLFTFDVPNNHEQRLCQTCNIDHTINRNTHAHTQSVTMATPTLDAHTHKADGQWSKNVYLFDLLFIPAIMLVSCGGTDRHERV